MSCIVRHESTSQVIHLHHRHFVNVLNEAYQIEKFSLLIPFFFCNQRVEIINNYIFSG
jgi:hypothetical protein